MVRNLPEQGAALDVASLIRIPPYFTLVFDLTAGAGAECRLDLMIVIALPAKACPYLFQPALENAPHSDRWFLQAK
jgi:hypothetical protein